ncbi:MAG TPA: hypothetical protein ENJ20_06180 [Bacteroidetes bacterium]|nr:hypothetical protein [Bacteroidota bacterium]
MLKLIFKNALTIALLATLAITSCDKVTDVVPEETAEQFVDQALYTLQDEGNLGRHGCYELVFPVTVALPDSTTATADSYEELAEIFRTWKEDNPGMTGRPRFVFPIEVINRDGELITVENGFQLRRLRRECIRNWFMNHGPNGHHAQCQPCFKLVFPVTIEFPDGTTAEAENRMELKMLIREWKMDNPGVPGRPHLVFPLQVEMTEDGTIVTVNNREELKELRESCE